MLEKRDAPDMNVWAERAKPYGLESSPEEALSFQRGGSASRFHRLYRLFADILEYPTPDLAKQAKACADLLLAVNPEAAVLLDRFRAFMEQASLSHLEELYTSTFDLQFGRRRECVSLL